MNGVDCPCHCTRHQVASLLFQAWTLLGDNLWVLMRLQQHLRSRIQVFVSNQTCSQKPKFAVRPNVCLDQYLDPSFIFCIEMLVSLGGFTQPQNMSDDCGGIQFSRLYNRQECRPVHKNEFMTRTNRWIQVQFTAAIDDDSINLLVTGWFPLYANNSFSNIVLSMDTV